jgi:NDP-sugar pyrophosphorylase family protein
MGRSVAILAGGLATRLGAVTAATPKSLLEVAGEPFLAHQLRLLASHGIEHAVLCVGHLGQQIVDTLGNHAFGVRLDYSFDGEKLVGTAGALRRALPLLPQQFFVLYGDSFLRCDYQAAWRAFQTSGRLGLMTVFLNEGGLDHSNVIFDGQRIVSYDKVNRVPAMKYIDYGLGVLDRAAFADVPADQPFDLAVLYQQLLAAGQLAAFEVHERYYEIGSHRGLEELRALLGASA